MDHPLTSQPAKRSSVPPSLPTLPSQTTPTSTSSTAERFHGQNLPPLVPQQQRPHQHEGQSSMPFKGKGERRSSSTPSYSNESHKSLSSRDPHQQQHRRLASIDESTTETTATLSHAPKSESWRIPFRSTSPPHTTSAEHIALLKEDDPFNRRTGNSSIRESDHKTLPSPTQQQREDIPILSRLGSLLSSTLKDIVAILDAMEVFIANLPLTIGAVGLSWVTMGTVWFKFMEEMLDDCHPVFFYSSSCHFGEFPGCFDCSAARGHPYYEAALSFHYLCSTVAGICCLLFILKVLIAGRVVADELSHPTTSTPMGVVCIAVVCVFAGNGGRIGEIMVVATSWFHLGLSLWFLYMAILRFGLWPDPGWFPNTIGLTYGAVKTFLYYPTLALYFLGLAVIYFVTLFFVSVIRVALNPKIAAPIAWIALSGPSITMYALTLGAQPTKELEPVLANDPSLMLQYREWMSYYYLPLQHVMMILSLVGLVSAVSALCVRWTTFSKKAFSPAHAAFCFPTLSHTNAIQAYRGAVNAYSTLDPRGPFHVTLFMYWCVFLLGGTILNLVFTYMFVQRLPEWTKINTVGDDEIQEPVTDDPLISMTTITDTDKLPSWDRPPFLSTVNPAVIQANEVGALVRVRRDTEDYRVHGPYVRSRKVKALGFDPIMDEQELRQERAQLLEWVATNAPRTRNRTMSNPAFFQNLDLNYYGTFFDGHRRRRPHEQIQLQNQQHRRSVTTTDIRLPGL